MRKAISLVKPTYYKSRAKANYAPWVVDFRKFQIPRKFFDNKAEAQQYVDSVVDEFVDQSDTRDWTIADLLRDFDREIDIALENGERSKSWVQERKTHCRQLACLSVNGQPVTDILANALEYKDVKFHLLRQMSATRQNKTVKNWLGSMIALFNFAIDKNNRETNPFIGTRDGRKLRINTNKKCIQAAKAKRIHADRIDLIISHMNPEWQRITRVAAETGMRQGEMRALTWDDVLFDSLKIQINKAVEHRTQIAGPPKTASAHRKIPMTGRVKKILKEIYFQQGRPAGHKLVFTTASGHTKSMNSFLAAIIRACDKAGVERIRWHDLRHFYASMMLKSYTGDAGVWKVSKILGHKTPAITQSVYGHWLDGDDEEARRDSDAISAVFG